MTLLCKEPLVNNFQYEVSWWLRKSTCAIFILKDKRNKEWFHSKLLYYIKRLCITELQSVQKSKADIVYCF